MAGEDRGQGEGEQGMGIANGIRLGLCSVLLLLAGCGLDGTGPGGSGGSSDLLGGGGIGGSGDGGGTAAIQMTLVGRQAPGIDALDVTVEGIDLLRNAQSSSDPDGWVLLTDEVRTYDILQLIDGQMAILADMPFEPGAYDKIRIRFNAATITVYGLVYDMQLVGGGQSIEIPLSDLIVEDGQVTEVGLDFDPVQSVKVLGNGSFQLNPELNLVDYDLYGALWGRVGPLGIGARVAAYRAANGKLVAAAEVREDGTYLIPRLRSVDEAGNPILYNIEATADGYPSQAYTDVQVFPGEENGGFDFLLIWDPSDDSEEETSGSSESGFGQWGHPHGGGGSGGDHGSHQG